MTKITVIVPFYKVEKYFEKCIQSILNQSLKDLEIFLIDDCGADSSEEIAQKYAALDKRIKIIKNNRNRWQGYSRNVGIKLAKGEFISFVDADDWLEPNAYEVLYKKAEETNADIIKCSFNRVSEEGTTTYNIEKFCPDFSRIYSVYDNPTLILGGLITNVWQGIYKKDFLTQNKIFFNEKIRCEDIMFEWQTRLAAKKIAFTPEQLYNYNKCNIFADTKQFNITESTLIQNLLIIKSFIIDKPLFHNAYILKCYEHLIWLLSFIPSTKHPKFIRYFADVLMKEINTDNLNEFKSLNYNFNRITSFINYNPFKDFYKKVFASTRILMYY